MGIDARKRQKRLERKAAKRKKHLAQLRKLAGKGNSFLLAAERFVDSKIPLHECLMPENLFELGLGNVVISRKLANQVTAAVFLLDLYCLGVKGAALFSAISTDEYDEMVDRLESEASLIPLQPACARKLIEGALAYAQDLGFSPHEDYRRAKVIFGDIDSTECPMTFEYGREGMPLFVSGPNDNSARCAHILETLTRRCGPDGFHYLLGGKVAESWDEEEFEEESEEE